MQIGAHLLQNPSILAPMAGITDRPFRSLCKTLGAGLAVSEMVSTNPSLRNHRKTRLKADHSGEPGISWVQILGSNPDWMADAARYNVDQGADMIDINMGCPAKKVCGTAAGSALLKDETLVAAILEAVVTAVDVPVTLKIRTGWDPAHRNALNIARIAESAGIQALTVHGRTRACGFTGQAEYDTVRQVKQSVRIPVIANGDITTPAKAVQVLADTGANAIMIGRAALGYPWIFRAICDTVTHQRAVPTLAPAFTEWQQVLLQHIQELHAFYGSVMGVRIARKHIGWYFKQASAQQASLSDIYQAATPEDQLHRISTALSQLDAPLSL